MRRVSDPRSGAQLARTGLTSTVSTMLSRGGAALALGQFAASPNHPGRARSLQAMTPGHAPHRLTNAITGGGWCMLVASVACQARSWEPVRASGRGGRWSRGSAVRQGGASHWGPCSAASVDRPTDVRASGRQTSPPPAAPPRPARTTARALMPTSDTSSSSGDAANQIRRPRP